MHLCSRDLKLDQMTLMYELDLDIMKMHLRQNEGSRSRLSKVRSRTGQRHTRQTDRQTDRETQPNQLLPCIRDDEYTVRLSLQPVAATIAAITAVVGFSERSHCLLAVLKYYY